jgi:hypothetical protein
VPITLAVDLQITHTFTFDDFPWFYSSQTQIVGSGENVTYISSVEPSSDAKTK